MRTATCLFMLFWLATCTSAQASINITSNYIQAGVYDAGSGGDYEIFTGTAIPTNTTITAGVGGTSQNPEHFSKTTINYSKSATNAVLRHEIDQKRGGDLDSYSYAAESSLFFTATQNTSYKLSGKYSITDNGSAGRVHLGSYLYDYTAGAFLLDSWQESRNTVNESFDLGGTDGDSYYYLYGSLTGNLIAGHQYQWYSYALTHAYPDADSGASAKGFVQLSIGEISAVPEASSIIAWTMVLGGIGLIVYKRQMLRGTPAV